MLIFVFLLLVFLEVFGLFLLFKNFCGKQFPIDQKMAERAAFRGICRRSNPRHLVLGVGAHSSHGHPVGERGVLDIAAIKMTWALDQIFFMVFFLGTQITFQKWTKMAFFSFFGFWTFCWLPFRSLTMPGVVQQVPTHFEDHAVTGQKLSDSQIQTCWGTIFCL